jgi:hypothetical protein
LSERPKFDPLGIILTVPIRRRWRPRDQLGGDAAASAAKSKDRRDRLEQAARIVRKAPEVLVKVSGSARGFQHLREHLNYITRNGELIAETPATGLVAGRDSVHETAVAWWRQREVVPGTRQKNSRETVNLVLSMPAGTNSDALLEAARRFAARTFLDHDYLMVMHTPENDPPRKGRAGTKQAHVHLTVKARGYEGQRLNPRKEDLQRYREWFAEALREMGVAAEASPRRARGVVQKPKRQSILHLDVRNASKIQRAKVAEAVREVTQQVAAGQRPWEDATWAKQKEIRVAWSTLADRFERDGAKEGAVFAVEIRRFLSDMPPLETERDTMKRAAVSALNRAKKAEKDRSK